MSQQIFFILSLTFYQFYFLPTSSLHYPIHRGASGLCVQCLANRTTCLLCISLSSPPSSFSSLLIFIRLCSLSHGFPLSWACPSNLGLDLIKTLDKELHIQDSAGLSTIPSLICPPQEDGSFTFKYISVIQPDQGMNRALWPLTFSYGCCQRTSLLCPY